MAKTPSNMLALGTAAPEFKLPDTANSNLMSFADVKSDKATVVMFICNHCPFVVHVIEKVVEIAKNYQQKGLSFVAISSNDVVKYPDDSPEKMKEFAETYGFSFPYLYDESQNVAKAYEAACTPDFYVFDASSALVYRGRMDGATPGNDVPVTGEELTNALDCILEGADINSEQNPSLGCNIKWKS